MYRKYPDDDDAEEESIRAIHNKTSIHLYLDNHLRIAECLCSIDPSKHIYSPSTTPTAVGKKYLEKHRSHIKDPNRKSYARQILESAEYIHT